MDIFFFDVPCMFHVLLKSDADLSKSEFKTQWKSIKNNDEMSFTMDSFPSELTEKENLV
jgi:hypothetical protein